MRTSSWNQPLLSWLWRCGPAVLNEALHKNIRVNYKWNTFCQCVLNLQGEVLLEHVLFSSLPATARPAPVPSLGLQEGLQIKVFQSAYALQACADISWVNGRNWKWAQLLPAVIPSFCFVLFTWQWHRFGHPRNRSTGITEIKLSCLGRLQN